MAVPDYQQLLLPLLRLASDGQGHYIKDATRQLEDEFGLTPEERAEMIPSRQMTRFRNRVGWARTYLKMAGLIEYVRRGYFRITERGQEVMASNPETVDVKFLEQFEEFREFQKGGTHVQVQAGAASAVQTPEEVIENAYVEIRKSLVNEILDKIVTLSPGFFERLVVDLLVKMGYGGSRKDAGQALGRVGDEGIDGVIKQDNLGLDVVYIQAKRWTSGTVGRPEIQKFAGALQGQRARRGIFITTSSFTADAEEYARKIESRIILIDGQALAQYMIDYHLGVTTVASYEIKRIDYDFFIEDESV